MSEIYLYNSLIRKKEKFTPINGGVVRMYNCGPTVYYYPHIGNWRTFVFEDILRRVLEYNGYQVMQVMNFTDVGHLTGDNIGNPDVGEDRVEQEAKKEGKSAWQIAEFYIQDFKGSLNAINIKIPAFLVRATDHIPQQINLVKRLLKRGLAYITETGVFFEVSKFPNYGKLGGQKLVDKRSLTREELVEDKTKRHPADFALWKLSRPGEKRQMEWKSPWGVGFPGWHLECSAMALKYLGETLDIHTGGVDHIAVHHTNEIAQSEGATGKPFSNYWLHGEFLIVDEGRMGKSLGNAYTLRDVVNKGFNPLALRYLYLNAHYRSVLNFTWEALQAASNALDKLYDFVLKTQSATVGCRAFEESFLTSINDDLNIPSALSVMWSMLKSEDSNSSKKASLLKFDQVLGLELEKRSAELSVIPVAVRELVERRDRLRLENNFTQADKIRKEIESMGFTIEDTPEGSKVRRNR